MEAAVQFVTVSRAICVSICFLFAKQTSLQMPLSQLLSGTE